MPTYLSDELGTQADTIFVGLGGERIAISTGWTQTESILAQPSNWSLELGWGDVAASLLAKYPKGTFFQLFVGNHQQSQGSLDGPASSMSPGGATTVTLSGRDPLARLHDTYAQSTAGINVGTYADLVWYALGKCNLTGGLTTVDPSVLHTDNNANRALKSGVPSHALAPHRTLRQILDDASISNVGIVTSPQPHVGDTWLTFLRRYLDRAGLMLWAAADGSFVLASPDGDQAASYTIRRRTGDPSAGGNIVGHRFADLATGRHTKAIVYGREGRGKQGHGKVKGVFVDQEMVDAGYGDQPIVHRDVNVASVAEAVFFARRKLAEERRNGYLLEYTISGLTLPYAPTGGSDRAVVIPDTVVTVDDDMLGINGDFWIESVTRRRSPQTTTTMRLMRIEDLLFGSPETDDETP